MPRIETATSRDAAEILALQRLAYQSEAILYDDWSIPPLTQTETELEQELYETICLKYCEPEGRVIGSVRAVMLQGSCYIGRLIVHPEHQRQGLGTKLMAAIEAAFPAATRFELFTGSRSEGNIRLYQRLGYRIFSRKQLSSQVELVLMEKLRAVIDRHPCAKND